MLCSCCLMINMSKSTVIFVNSYCWSWNSLWFILHFLIMGLSIFFESDAVNNCGSTTNWIENNKWKSNRLFRCVNFSLTNSIVCITDIQVPTLPKIWFLYYIVQQFLSVVTMTINKLPTPSVRSYYFIQKR